MLTAVIRIFQSLVKFSPCHAFKIVNINGDPRNKNVKITYQVSGKSTTIEEKPDLLIKELMQLNGFSKNDSELIYKLAIAEKMSNSYKITSIRFETTPSQFEIEDVSLKHTFFLTAEEIVGSNTLLSKFSSNDILIIYFQMMSEKDQKKQKNKLLLQQANNEVRGKIYILPK